jgi:PD-(D/E)XK nuclease superfamily protein
MKFPEITEKIIVAALKVHSGIGPGVLESVYKTCLVHELKQAGMTVSSEVALPVVYNGLKCVETLFPIHKAQLLTYLRLSNKPIGLLLNFNVIHLRDGIKRILNNKSICGNSRRIGILLNPPLPPFLRVSRFEEKTKGRPERPIVHLLQFS